MILRRTYFASFSFAISSPDLLCAEFSISVFTLYWRFRLTGRAAISDRFTPGFQLLAAASLNRYIRFSASITTDITPATEIFQILLTQINKMRISLPVLSEE